LVLYANISRLIHVLQNVSHTLKAIALFASSRRNGNTGKLLDQLVAGRGIEVIA
jgi:hypothetical protein